MIVALMIGSNLVIDAITNGYPSILIDNVISVFIVIVLGYYCKIKLLNDQSSWFIFPEYIIMQPIQYIFKHYVSCKSGTCLHGGGVIQTVSDES